MDPKNEQRIRKVYDRYLRSKADYDQRSNELSEVMVEVLDAGESMYGISQVIPMTGENVRTRVKRWREANKK